LATPPNELEDCHSGQISAAVSRAAERQRAQLPAFAPLLEELEIAGWSSHRWLMGGNFHDWLLVDNNRVLVTVGHATGSSAADPTEAALVAQAVWSTVRAHAFHAPDAGAILSRSAQTLWSAAAAATRACVAVAVVDTARGQASVALAGDCLAWRVRAASCDQLVIPQPLLGGVADFRYLSHSLQLSLRERLILAADNSLQRASKQATSIALSFSRLDAESHRRMTAADAVRLVRQNYEQLADTKTEVSASVAAIRRR
jgi:hypothetical protein